MSRVAARRRPATTSEPRPRPSAVAAGLALGALNAPIALGISAVPVALPAYGRDVGAAPAALAWILAAYTLALAVNTALSGRLVERFGLRAVLRSGVGAVVVGSAACSASSSLGTTIAARLLQGAGAAAITVAALALVSVMVAEEERQRALGSLTALVGLLSGSGTLIGGVIASAVGWRAVFALPALTVVGYVLVVRHAPGVGASRGMLDIRGAALTAVAAGGLLTVLQARSTHLGTAVALVIGGVTAAACAELARHLRRRPDGFVPRAIAASAGFRGLACAGFGLFAGYLAMLYAAPLLLLRLHPGWGTVAVGAVLLPAGLSAAGAARAVGRVGDSKGPWVVVPVLAVLSSAGIALAAAAGASGPVPVVIGLTAAVSGFAGGQVALLGALPGVVDDARRATAVGLFNLVFIAGGAFGSAAVGALGDAVSLRAAVGVMAAAPVLFLILARLASGRTRLQPVH